MEITLEDINKLCEQEPIVALKLENIALKRKVAELEAACESVSSRIEDES